MPKDQRAHLPRITTSPRRAAPAFPAERMPEDPTEQKLLGLYAQRQEGFVLQRVRVPGGRLSSAQWRALADAAEALGARPALHLTTRQCIEVHGLVPDAVPELHVRLGAAGLTTAGAAGDTLRNSTVDPEGGLVPGTWDLLPLALAVDAAVGGFDGLWSLPRKFKISFSGSDRAAMLPWATDLGFIAESPGTLTAVVAGSLGAKPGTGILYREGLTAGDAIALAVAAVRLHDLEGDRENRSRARLRHVRERMGDAPFVELLDGLFGEERRHTIARPAAPLPVQAPQERTPEHLRLLVPRGDLTLAVVRALADAIDTAPGSPEVRIGIGHDLHVFGVATGALPETARAWLGQGRVVACPGTDLCSKAVGPTGEAEAALAPLAAANPGLLFSVSGCPNACSHVGVADIGLIARTKREGDARVPVYRVFAGGDAGRGPGLARLVAADVPLSQLAGTVERLLGERNEAGAADPGELSR